MSRTRKECPRTWCPLIDDDYWKGRFPAHGWCVTEVKLISDTTLSLQTRHFLTYTDKTDTERNHRGCDTQHCLVYQNDLGAHQTQHVSKECDCEENPIDPKGFIQHFENKSSALDTGEATRKEGLAVKRAHARLHIHLTPIPPSVSAEFALATAFSTQLISDLPRCKNWLQLRMVSMSSHHHCYPHPKRTRSTNLRQRSISLPRPRRSKRPLRRLEAILIFR